MEKQLARTRVGGLLAKPTRLVFQKWNVSGREIPPRYQIQFLDSPARLPTGKVFNTISGSNSEITEPGMANARLSGQNMQLWCDLEDSSCSLLFFLTLEFFIYLLKKQQTVIHCKGLTRGENKKTVLLTVIILPVSVFSLCTQLNSCDRLFLIESFAL